MCVCVCVCVFIYLLFLGKNKTFTSYCLYLKKFLFHLVLHQIRSEASLSAGEVISGDGEGNLRGVQRFLQPPPGGRQQVCFRDQPLDELLQLGPPAVDVLQAAAQVFGAHGLRVIGEPLLGGVFGAPVARRGQTGGCTRVHVFFNGGLRVCDQRL
uniref:Uncharacterized protein n=1 Tax=Cyprinus carpio carpio TaxID=630221 RepID=A0A9J8AWT6_CYPCA